MRKLILFMTVVAFFLLGVNLTSCVNNEENEVPTVAQQSENVFSVYQSSQNFILTRDPNALDEIEKFMRKDCLSTKSTQNQSMDSVKLQMLEDFMNERQIDDNNLVDYLEEHPEEIEGLVKTIASDEFYTRFIEIPNLYTQDLIDQFILSVMDSAQISNLEKGLLMLFVASEYNYDPATRSLSSCIKRYAKLTAIAVNALKISLTDAQSGVEYATRELENMGSEYDC